MSTSSSLPLIRRLVSTYLRPYRGRLILAISFMLLAAAMTALFAKLIQPVMDDVLVRAAHDPHARSLILPMGVAIFACFGLRGMASYGQSLTMARISQSIIADVQNDLFRHLVHHDLSFFHTNPSGQLTSRIVSDVNVMRLAVSDALTGMGNSFVTLVLLTAVMIYQDWQLALIALTVLPVASGMVAILGRRLRKISRSIQDQTAILVDRLSEVFQSIRQVQAYGMEDAESKSAEGAINDVRRLNVKSIQVGEMITPINEILVGIAIFAIVVYGGLKIADGMASAGSLLSFIAAFALAYEPMKKLGKLNNSLQMGLGAAERVFTLIDDHPRIVNHRDAIPLVLPAPPTIIFQDVSFTYPSTDTPALDHINAMFGAGKMTALVGASGGGKSTLINLLLRFYDPDTGAIFINGHDLRSLTLASLRSHIALVSQDVRVFNTSIRENIRYGTTIDDPDQIIDAARAAAADEFIRDLPHGYDTIVGENGVRLSGGQRQRLAIARALLRDAPILLLDEATSALDNTAEKIVQESFAATGKGRTMIVIAHRLSTVQHADQIIVMDTARILETGRHDDLMARGAAYARLYGTLSTE